MTDLGTILGAKVKHTLSKMGRMIDRESRILVRFAGYPAGLNPRR